jgi:hypothetical protein
MLHESSPPSLLARPQVAVELEATHAHGVLVSVRVLSSHLQPVGYAEVHSNRNPNEDSDNAEKKSANYQWMLGSALHSLGGTHHNSSSIPEQTIAF